MPWPATLLGAWHVLRANQAWAPVPHNDPEAARRHMRRFCALVRSHGAEGFDVADAARREAEWWRVHRARREVEWWRAHRAHQRDADATADGLTSAVARRCALGYDVTEAGVHRAAGLRAQVMDASDIWVGHGCRGDDPLLDDERVLLVRPGAALLSAVDG